MCWWAEECGDSNFHTGLHVSLLVKKKKTNKKSQYYLIADMTVEVCQITDCLNGGVCIRQGNTERCLCTAGYYGEECEDSLVKKIISANERAFTTRLLNNLHEMSLNFEQRCFIIV